MRCWVKMFPPPCPTLLRVMTIRHRRRRCFTALKQTVSGSAITPKKPPMASSIAPNVAASSNMPSNAAIVSSGFVTTKYKTGIARSVMTSIVWGNPMSTPHFKASWTASGLEVANEADS